MKLKKDIFLDVVYSMLFAVAIQLNNTAIGKSDSGLLFALRNLILVSILLLWLKALSRNHAGVLVVVHSGKNSSPIKSGLGMLKQFLEMKICCYLLVFCCYSFFMGTFEFNQIHYYVIKIFVVGFYTLSIFLICSAYFRISITSWQFSVLFLGPHFLLLIASAVVGDYSVASILPSNIQFIPWGKVTSPSGFVYLILNLTLFIILITYFFKSINKITEGPKYYNLQERRVN